MKVKFIQPAYAEAARLALRPIKYSLFAPLALPTLAGFLDEGDAAEFQDENVEALRLDDEPDLIAVRVCVNSARRAYQIADHYRRRGIHVCLGGLHGTALPEEAAAHADTVFLGPGEDTWPRFLDDFRTGRPQRLYISRRRSLAGVPPPRRDLLRRGRYLVPNTIVVSRGCPHQCEFCANESFFAGGAHFYTLRVEEALTQVGELPGRHVYFLDDQIFGDRRFAESLFDGLRGMGKVWQAAGTVEAVLAPGLLERAAASGLRSLLIGFESLSQSSLRDLGKTRNVCRDYDLAVRRLHDNGVLINATFVAGMDHDGPDVFDRVVDWAVARGVETATFHILTPYPGTSLFRRLDREGRILTRNWDVYDTGHAVFRPARMTSGQLEDGYRRAYESFYRWRSVCRSALTRTQTADRIRHLLYAGGWRKFEHAWDLAIRTGTIGVLRPLLQGILTGFGRYRPAKAAAGERGQQRPAGHGVPVGEATPHPEACLSPGGELHETPTTGPDDLDCCRPRAYVQ